MRRGLRALRVPPRRAEAADLLLRGPGRVLPRHPQGPALHLRRATRARGARRRTRCTTSRRALLRLMAPILSFTAEEAWEVLIRGKRRQRVLRTPGTRAARRSAMDRRCVERWARLRESRADVQKELEELRAAGEIGSSLQAEVEIAAPAATLRRAARACGDDLRFVLITSRRDGAARATAPIAVRRRRRARTPSASAAGTTAPTSAPTPRIRRSAGAAWPTWTAPGEPRTHA